MASSGEQRAVTCDGPGLGRVGDHIGLEGAVELAQGVELAFVAKHVLNAQAEAAGPKHLEAMDRRVGKGRAASARMRSPALRSAARKKSRCRSVGSSGALWHSRRTRS